jgi:leader peptidase (prepilin peptidase) / N-methyltransferase
MTAAGVVLAALGGLVIGSFLNVVVWRVPRHESLLKPPSHCPGCDALIKPYDNVPVISWLVLRGRCRHCGEPISPRYPLTEALTAALYVAVVLARHDAAGIALGLTLVTVLVPVAQIDYDHQIIPNPITAVAAVAALVITLALDRHYIPEQLIAAAAAGGFFFVIAFLVPKGMGMGDAKLAGVLGLFLGRAVGPAIFIAFISGALIGVVVIARKGTREGRKTKVPFGVFLALGGVIALFAGDALANDYAHTLH